jgi:hypothetical protein
MLRTIIAALACAALLTSCDATHSSANAGPKTVITEAQFAELKATCNLSGAKLRASNYTETSTNADGVSMTVTTKYKDAPADGKSIQLPETMSEGDIAMAIPCLKGEFERLNIHEAPLSLPASTGF